MQLLTESFCLPENPGSGFFFFFFLSHFSASSAPTSNNLVLSKSSPLSSHSYNYFHILESSTNKTDCHDITEILLKVALNTTKQTNNKGRNVDRKVTGFPTDPQ
jgi:hypothetical protein